MVSFQRQDVVPTVGQLDHVAWPARLSFDAHGVRIGLRASDSSALGALQRVVPPGALFDDASTVDALYSLVLARGANRMHRLYEDDRCTARNADLEELLTAFQSQLHFKVAVAARTRLFVHAGVVGCESGAIVMPGRSHSGKSSLVEALVRAGATYYSDEYAVLDDDGLVHAFARPLGIRDALGRTQLVPASALGATIGETPLPVTLVVTTSHVPDALWRPRSMSPGETVLALLENTVAAQSRPADALRILCSAVAGAEGLRGARGDASDIAEVLLAHCSTPALAR